MEFISGLTMCRALTENQIRKTQSRLDGLKMARWLDLLDAQCEMRVVFAQAMIVVRKHSKQKHTPTPTPTTEWKRASRRRIYIHVVMRLYISLDSASVYLKEVVHTLGIGKA